MSAIDIDLSRVQISLHGVSAEVAESAMTGLDAELRRRLGRLSPGDFQLEDRADVALGDIRVQGRIDASALRGVIAERLVTALRGGAG